MSIPIRLTLPDRGVYRFFGPVIVMVVGVGAAIWFHLNAPWLVGWQRYLPYGLGGFFVLTGLISIVRELRRGAARGAAQRALEEHRDAPWRVRPEWRHNELSSSGTLDRSFLVFAVIWNLVSWPLAYVVIRGDQSSGEGAVWLVALFPLIGIGVLAKVGFELARMRKFGNTVLALDPMPYRLGRSCGGRFRARVATDAQPADGFRVKVSCYRQRVRWVRDSDGDRTRQIERDLLWRDEMRSAGDPTMDGTGVEVPFAFHLPEDSPASTPLKLDNRVLWEVSADAEVPGIDFLARFEVPVFESEPGSDEVGESSAESLPRGEVVEAGTAWAFDEPLTDGIVLIDEPDLFELHFTAARKRKGAIALGVAGAVLLVGGFFAFSASGGVALMMVLIGAFLVYGSIQQATNDTVLRVRDGRIEVTHDGLGMPSDVDVPVGQIEDVLVHLATSSAAENARYAISLVARAGEGLEHLQDQAGKVMDVMSRLGVGEHHPAMDAMRKGAERPMVLVADDFSDKGEADWLASKIEQAVEQEAEGRGRTGSLGT